MNEIIQLQQFWLRSQSELVKTIKDVQEQSKNMDYLKKQYTILLQKKLRIEGKPADYFTFYFETMLFSIRTSKICTRYRNLKDYWLYYDRKF